MTSECAEILLEFDFVRFFLWLGWAVQGDAGSAMSHGRGLCHRDA